MPDHDPRVPAIRRFNRFYTRQIGLLHEGMLRSPYSLTEVRVMFELAHRDNPTAGDVARELGLDAGYLSRILTSFEKRRLARRKHSESDGRQTLLSLTEKGASEFAALDSGSDDEVANMLAKLPAVGQAKLVEAMRTIEGLLGAPPEQLPAYILRPPQTGDMGWIIHRHGVLYAQEYGWDEQFEALVAEIAAKFIQNYDAKKERCWIAEKDGAVVGSVFIVRQSDEVAKLRLLYVEPATRGLGLGSRLVDECIRFSRQAGYRMITLWTQSNLLAAQHVYRKAGFKLVREEPYTGIGRDLISQTWELTL